MIEFGRIEAASIGFFLIGCGSADTGFSLSEHIDGGVRLDTGTGGVIGTGGHSSATDAAANTGGFDTSCGPVAQCSHLYFGASDVPMALPCETDEQCCRGMTCYARPGYAPQCMYLGTPCAADTDCPCGTHCAGGNGTRMCSIEFTPP